MFKDENTRYTPVIQTKNIPQSTQIQRPILPFQKPQIPISQRVIQTMSVEREQLLNHRPRVQPCPRSGV